MYTIILIVSFCVWFHKTIFFSILGHVLVRDPVWFDLWRNGTENRISTVAWEKFQTRQIRPLTARTAESHASEVKTQTRVVEVWLALASVNYLGNA